MGIALHKIHSSGIKMGIVLLGKAKIESRTYVSSNQKKITWGNSIFHESPGSGRGSLVLLSNQELNVGMLFANSTLIRLRMILQ
jgi:hypothetical protein